MTNLADQQALFTQIIEAGKLGMKLFRMQNEDAELEQTGIAFEAAMAELRRNQEERAVLAAFMVSKLLAGRSFSMTSNTPENIEFLKAVARELGATVENSKGDFDELLPSCRSIMINPPDHDVERH
jgi:hypothetical protein